MKTPMLLRQLFQIRFVHLLLALCFSASAQGEEHIVSYHSDIQIAADASTIVTETIRVRAEGVNIRRGIYREFPTSYRDRAGNNYRVAFEVLRVARDGQPEQWNATERQNGVRVDFGGDDFLVVPREYEYLIQYRTTRQIGFYADHDELYWNVTGNGWSFIINAASATVTLPEAVPATDLAMEGYTGRFGANGQDYTVAVTDGAATIRTTAPLPASAGLTLVLSWPKGIVAEPDQVERVGYVLADNRGLLLALLALAAAALYLGRTWARVGRDPGPGVIFPHYEPPAGLAPAAARYVARMAYDSKALTAAIINLAVQGHLHITQKGNLYLLKRRKSEQPLEADEEVLLESLCASDEILVLDQKNHRIIGTAKRRHAKLLKQECQGKYFVTNIRALLPSIAGSALVLILIVAMARVVPLVIGIFVVIAIMHLVFAWLLKAPTAEGRELLDKLDGFKLYLEVAEKDDLNLRNPPQLTPALFERYLPYAIALGVEQAWAEKFAAALAAMEVGQRNAYHPLWYNGNFNVARIGAFTNAVSSSFSSAISSAASPPGSSSGAGGGGSSGGGGGGGGGGGR
jgi:uncharacterized membrane protein YgcG